VDIKKNEGKVGGSYSNQAKANVIWDEIKDKSKEEKKQILLKYSKNGMLSEDVLMKILEIKGQY